MDGRNIGIGGRLPITNIKVRQNHNQKFYRAITTLATHMYFSRFVFNPPFSFAEFSAIGRANSPWTANLALCARTAHQGGLVGNS